MRKKEKEPKQPKQLKITRIAIPATTTASAMLILDKDVREAVLEVLGNMKALDTESAMVSWTSPVRMEKEVADKVAEFLTGRGFPVNYKEETKMFRAFR